MDAGAQRQAPIALVEGQPITELPEGLYIPPDALEVILEAFEGPLDLLLYLIRRQNLDILDIPVADITRQYMEYIELMRVLRIELAAEYLVMAAALAEIKSRLLLPRTATEEEEEDDPRAQLIRRLQEYQRFKEAAQRLDAIPRLNRDFWAAAVDAQRMETPRPLPELALQDLLLELSKALNRAARYASHQINAEPLSTRERMSQILGQVAGSDGFIAFASLFVPAEGRPGVIVTFIAVMELVREALLDLVQTEPFAPIHVRASEDALL